MVFANMTDYADAVLTRWFDHLNDKMFAAHVFLMSFLSLTGFSEFTLFKYELICYVGGFMSYHVSLRVCL